MRERGNTGRVAHHEINFGPIASGVLMEIPVEMLVAACTCGMCVCVCVDVVQRYGALALY